MSSVRTYNVQMLDNCTFQYEFLLSISIKTSVVSYKKVSVGFSVKMYRKEI